MLYFKGMPNLIFLHVFRARIIVPCVGYYKYNNYYWISMLRWNSRPV